MRSEEEAERTAVHPTTVMVDRLDVALTGSCSQRGRASIQMEKTLMSSRLKCCLLWLKVLEMETTHSKGKAGGH